MLRRTLHNNYLDEINSENYSLVHKKIINNYDKIDTQ